jgi:LysM repeat protein
MIEQMLKVTKSLRLIPVLLTLVLVVSLSGIAFAAPPFQEGGDNEGGAQQDTTQNEADEGDDDAQQSLQPQSQSQQGAQQGQFQEDTQQPGATQQGTQPGQLQQGQQQGQFQPTAGACAQTYTVQAGDWLSRIAERFYGDVQSYQVIFDATNAAGANNGFATLNDPDLIEVGQVLCIPAQGAQQAGTQPGQQGQFQQGGEQAMQDDMFSVPEGMSKVIFENLSSRDLIVDVSGGPTPQSVWVGPGTRQEFVVQPGAYVIIGHQPGEEFGVTPHEVELTAGQLLGLVCDDTAQCRMQQGVQNVLAMMEMDQGVGQGATQQGQQPGTMQPGQQGQQPAQQPGTIQQGQPETTPQNQQPAAPQDQGDDNNNVEDNNSGTGG